MTHRFLCVIRAIIAMGNRRIRRKTESRMFSGLHDWERIWRNVCLSVLFPLLVVGVVLVYRAP